VACSDCGLLQESPELPARAVALCALCGKRLERTSGHSLDAALLCSLGTLGLLIPANILPLMHVSILGMTRESRMASGVRVMWDQHWVLLAGLVGACAIVFPLARFTVLSATLTCLRLGLRKRWLGPAFRWSHWLAPWAMPDVFLIGCAVGYSRLAATADVTVDPGGICIIFAAILAMLTQATLDRRAVWRAISPEPTFAPAQAVACTACELVQPVEMHTQPCPRCGLRLHGRKPDALIRTTALVIAGLVLYVPANVFPMSTDLQLGERVDHRIVDGIADLFRAGLWPLGVLIFCTSITIPLLKLAGLGWLLLSVRRGSPHHLRRKTRLYRLIDEIGRWSNIDVFTIAVFAPLLQFGALATAGASGGATAFILVVTLTMLASRAFDPRMLWDAGLARRS
jgi:paraquat-inducible protein A